MSVASKTPRKRASVKSVKRSLTIRMYNVGFGDAFLVAIPGVTRTHRILFDCGSIKANGEGIDEVVDHIVEDCTDKHGAHIDLVIATHRHRDHVSGFASNRWNKVSVGEVWMPWTEDPRDPAAKKIRESQSNLAVALEATLTARAEVSGAMSASLAPTLDMVRNALKNEAAMDTLHNGFAGSPVRRFLPTKNAGVEPITIQQLPGVQIFVLGPSRDEAVIRDMDPPKGMSYLTLRAGLDSSGNPPEPLAPDWRYTAYASAAASSSSLDEDDRRIIDSFSEDSSEGVAVALDKAVNGTSLMIVLKVGQAHLLFPGDAQWGTWKAALDVPEWQALLKKTAFYKIGHHGSHNATPKRFVEEFLPTNFGAMASVVHVPTWPNIPKLQLLDALKKKTPKIVRSDQTAKVKGFTYQRGGNVVSMAIPF